ncbi:homeodomain-like, SAWADEE domain protein [Artemisia annua]|uniref:Homeodomain-like, SAWADEE domain protein n=1 Tax=Artemisia annua TaxID=35608 RepID=A0A2U1MLL7_ARTAN|nr:homeodomain-like, SAWADEE domain protein [Artemisia annua]
MGRPPSNGGPSFRFTPPEIAEMEAILQANQIAVPERQILVSLAEKFSATEERKGKMEVQMKQVWNWFQNRRYAIKSKQAKSPGKLDVTQMPRDNSAMVKPAPQPTQPLAASTATVKTLPQAPQHPTVPAASVRTFPQAPQHLPPFSAPSSGRFTDNSQMEYEAKSARDGAWYDVSTFLSHRAIDTGDPEVLVRFAGFGAEEDEWVNVRKNVRQRSLPCEASECVAVLSSDLILCFQEGKEQALYFDAHVLDAQRRRHDVRGCRCRFLVRYDHDQSEEIVALRKICRRPETDYRLQQLHAANESISANQNKSVTNNNSTVNTLRVYPPAEVQPKQQKVEHVAPSAPAEAQQKRQRLDSTVPPEGSQMKASVEPVASGAPPGFVPQNQQRVQAAVPAPSAQPSVQPQKVDTVVPPSSNQAPLEPKKVEPVVSAPVDKIETTVPSSGKANQELQTASQEPVAAGPTVPASTKVSPSVVASSANMPAEAPGESIERKPEVAELPKELVVSGSSVEVTKTEEPVAPVSTNDTNAAQEPTETKTGKPMTPVSTDDPKVVQELAETKPEEPMVPISTDDPNMVQDAIKTNNEEPVAPVSTNVVGEATEAKTEEPAVPANDPMVIEAENEQPKLSETMDSNKSHAKDEEIPSDNKVENSDTAPENAAVAMEEGAVLLPRFGNADVMEIRDDVRVPDLKDDDVLVRVRAVSVNPLDTRMRAGYGRSLFESLLPLVLGRDVSGEVAAVGASVRTLNVGQEVFGALHPTAVRGTYADYAVLAEDQLTPKPSTISHVEASAIPFAALTAWRALKSTARITKGQRVLVIGGGGAVGFSAIQLAVATGCAVSSTCESESIERLLAAGAEQALDYTAEDLEVTLKGHYNAVLDTIGIQQTEKLGISLLKRGGHYMTLQGESAKLTDRYGLAIGLPTATAILLKKQIQYRLSHGIEYWWTYMRTDAEGLDEIRRLTEAGKLKVPVQKTFPITQVCEAHDAKDKRIIPGKVVLEVD